MQRILGIYKNAYSGLSPSTWWLSLVMLINRSGTMVFPFMTLYLTERLHYSIGQAGLVMIFFGLGAVCGSFAGGKLTDKLGFYNIQLFALLGGGILFILLGQMTSLTSICICTFVLSVVNDAFRPANSTAIAHYSKEENRTRSYSVNRLSINIGWSVGSAAAGFIAAHNYHLLFWIDGLTNIGAALLLRAVLAPARNAATPGIKKVKEKIVKSHSAYKDKAYIFFVCLTILYAFCFFQVFTTMPVYYREHLHLSTSFIGLTMAMNGVLIALFELIIIFQLEGKRNPLHFITLGVVMIAASYLIFNVLPGAEVIAILSMLLGTVGEILSMPFMNTYWISRTNNNNRGQYAGLYSVGWSVAQVLGPGSGAQIAQHWGFATLWWIIGGLSIATALGYKWLQYRTK